MLIKVGGTHGRAHQWDQVVKQPGRPGPRLASPVVALERDLWAWGTPAKASGTKPAFPPAAKSPLL